MTDTTDLPDRITDYDGYNAEYQAAVAALDLELPDGVALPEDAPFDPDQGEAHYAEGTGEVAALFAWRFEVERAAIEAHLAGDAEEALRWVREAGKFVLTDTFAKYNDHDAPGSWYEAVIVPALAGDMTVLLEMHGISA